MSKYIATKYPMYGWFAKEAETGKLFFIYAVRSQDLREGQKLTGEIIEGIFHLKIEKK